MSTPTINDNSNNSRSSASQEGAIVLPNGGVMKAQDLDHQIDRLFDFKQKFEEAWTKGKRTLVDEDTNFERKVVSAESSVADDDKDQPPTKRAKQSPTSETIVRPLEEILVGAPSRSPATVAPAPTPTIAAPQLPGQDLTGVSPALTSICATISDQIYSVETIHDFHLTNEDAPSVTAEVILFEDHGALSDVIPPFCVAVTGSCLILAWRGSKTIMDWVSDVTYAPVTSSRWNRVAAQVRAHAAYASLIESDLATHEAWILDQVQQRKIKTLILTGHSLAGGLAQVAQLAIEGQLQAPGSLWYPLRKALEVRSVAFAAPMTILLDTSQASQFDTKTRVFLEGVASRSCNIVYGPDIVPHGSGDLKYVLDVVTALIPEVVSGLPYSWVLKMFGMESKIFKGFESLISKENVKGLAQVMVQYHHLGTVVYYPTPAVGGGSSSNPAPAALRDSQFLPNSIPEFRGSSVIQVPKTDKKTGSTISGQLQNAHSYLLESFSYSRTTTPTK
jgi:hypothetical protein